MLISDGGHSGLHFPQQLQTLHKQYAALIGGDATVPARTLPRGNIDIIVSECDFVHTSLERMLDHFLSWNCELIRPIESFLRSVSSTPTMNVSLFLFHFDL
jgi:hypothetical protein